jgi:ribonucleotide reductase alpha subunit
MRVLKRDNTYEDVSLDKVQKRIAGQCEGLNVDIIEIAQKVCSRIHDGVKTSTLDDEAARLCAQLITKHPDYGVVAARIAISNHQKKTSPSFSETINMLYTVTDIHGNKNPLISDELWNIVQIHKDKLNSIINYDRDYNYDYFGFKTLERSYLLKVNGKIVERPQHMIMRVALGIHGWDLKEAIETYELMSTRYFTHATPTLFNAGTPRSQLASCYLMGMDDSITGMYKTLGDCAQISKYAGGIGIHIHDIRPTGSYIRGTNGYSTGIVPMLRVYNAAGRHVNQCFRGDTIIYTKTGYKNIESIEVGDNVITIDNTVKPVLGISRKEVDEELYVISCKWTQLNESREGVYVTGEHQIFTLDENDNIIEVSACELTTENYVGYPIALGPTSYVKLLHDMYWVKIDKIDKKHYKGFVYDLNIQDNHNYLTNMGIVHNSGKRNGSIAVYLEPWHSDIEAFLDLRKNSGNHEERCHDLFTAMWVPDLFMKRVDANQEWSLMCPDECPGLSTTYGDEFEALYTKYEAEGKYKKKVKAQTLFYSIMRSQIETGTPYMVYKDSANKKNNQMNLGTLKSSNLCSEVLLFSDTKETAVCNLASIGLPTYVKYTKDIEKGDGIDNVIPYYDFKELHRVVQVITRNLNKVIDRTFYPTPETRLSNLRHRPIGIGVQGLANTYVLMRMPFESAEAADLNRKIFATIYHAALTASVAISRRRSEYREELNDSNTSQDRKEFLINYLNMIPEEELLVGQYSGTYSSFMGSPASSGKLQYDLWGVTEPETVDGLLDWTALKEDIAKYGLRNSTLLAPMPTATTSQILGFNESFEAFTSNIFQRQTLAGEFTIINRHLIDDLLKLGLWNTEMKDKILAAGGSVQGIPEIPEQIRLLYKTVWEIKQKIVIDQSAERGPYVCQSQSLNIHLEDPDFAKMTNVHFYGWKKGLKTGMYYLRSRPKAKITAFTLDPTKQNQNTGTASTSTKQQPSEEEIMACRRDNPEGCVMCSG